MGNKVVLAIDPGYDRLGYAIALISNSQFSILKHGLIQTNKKDSLFDRYKLIMAELSTIITQFKPSELAIEELYFSKNTKTALRVSEVKGLIISLALQNNLQVFEYHPNQIKLAVTGHGKADKKAVEKMLRLELK